MKRILVTGANKGIGLAICKAILKERSDTYTFLCARDVKKVLNIVCTSMYITIYTYIYNIT